MSKSIKTYQKWENSGKNFDAFINPMDEVDEEMFMYFLEVLSPQFQIRNIFQSCESVCEDQGCAFYGTFQQIGERYFYLGALPAFEQPEYLY